MSAEPPPPPEASDAPGPSSEAFDPTQHFWDGTHWWSPDRQHYWDGLRWQSAHAVTPADGQRIAAFGEDVLATNRAGRMTGGQRRALASKEVPWVVAELVLGSVSVFAISKVPEAWHNGGQGYYHFVFYLAIVLPPCTFGLGSVVVSQLWETWRGRVKCASGVLRALDEDLERARDDLPDDERWDDEGGVGSHVYTLTVGHRQKFDVSHELYVELKSYDGEKWNIYYAPKSRTILSFERIGPK